MRFVLIVSPTWVRRQDEGGIGKKAVARGTRSWWFCLVRPTNARAHADVSGNGSNTSPEHSPIWQAAAGAIEL
ncbi:MAG: hypothetical protein ACXQTY_07890 [Candidatus Methanogasteraceae archaeon]